MRLVCRSHTTHVRLPKLNICDHSLGAAVVDMDIEVIVNAMRGDPMG
jgi:hypothetical protein